MIRLLDILVSSIILILFAIPAVFLAILIKLTSAGPIFYWSDRVGKDEILFSMPKFRTMRLETPVIATHLLGDPQCHLTPIGSFLRKSSLDEMPQFWCVLRGQMSIVGPRPALFNQTKLIAMRNSLGVHALTPGITGWAQIHGRDEITEEEKAVLDAHYLAIKSVRINLYIISKTIARVLSQSGISH